MQETLIHTSIPIEEISVSAYKIPTESPESDGTLRWDHTILVLTEISAGGKTGIGYTYADTSTAQLIQTLLIPHLKGLNALDIPLCWKKMNHMIRNLGRPGICSMAISATDVALWDLKAKIFNIPLVTLLGASRKEVPLYGSGGFTSYSDQQLEEQLSAWSASGFKMVKMKIGREPEKDLQRVTLARRSIGEKTELFVDANGAYEKKQALNLAHQFAEQGVTWFEEPVSSDDLNSLRFISENGPSSINISAGEYGYDQDYFRRMLEAKAVDVLQADATRCAGITGFFQADTLSSAFHIPFSSHCAPALHLHPACAANSLIHMEYFFDHARIEKLLFEGVTEPINGKLSPDLSRPGLGLEFKRKDSGRFAL